MTEDGLFDEWKRAWKFSAFIKDGMVCPEEYGRILFVLRDMNCREERDLRLDLARDGSGWKTWNNAARWALALLDGEEGYPKNMPRERRAAIMRRTAVMNMKKEGGASRAQAGEIEAAVRKQKDILRRQMEILAPDIVICCGLPGGKMRGTAELLREYVLKDAGEWKPFPSRIEGRKWWYYYAATAEGKKTIPVVSFCHPQTACLSGLRGHGLFEALYRDMLDIGKFFLGTEKKDGPDGR